jgi:hypothetical protein
MTRCGLSLRLSTLLVLAAGLLLAGLLAPPFAAAATPAPACPGARVTLQDLLDLAAAEGPLAAKYDTDPSLMSERAVRCFGHRTLRFAGFVRDPGVHGWLPVYGLSPGWFLHIGLFVATTTGPEAERAPLTSLAIRPGLGDLQAEHVGYWVTVTGHFDDPAAATCRAVGPAGATPTRAQAVAICRSIFVVTGVTRAATPSTSTATPSGPANAGSEAWLAVAAALGFLAALWYTGRARRA